MLSSYSRGTELWFRCPADKKGYQYGSPFAPGGDAGSRTRVRNKRPKASTSLATGFIFAGRSSSDHRPLVRLAEGLKPAYRRLRAAPYGL